MLILTRKLSESIIIGHDIKIILLSFNGSNARLGIEAPLHVSVHREEVYERINRNGNRQDNDQKWPSIYNSTAR